MKTINKSIKVILSAVVVAGVVAVIVAGSMQHIFTTFAAVALLEAMRER